MKRRSKVQSDTSSSGQASDAGFREEHPTLHEFMTATTYEDGGQRTTSSVSIFAEAGTWKAALHDRDLGQSLFVSGDTIADALLGLEIAASEDKADWRAWKGGKNGQGGNKSKK